MLSSTSAAAHFSERTTNENKTRGGVYAPHATPGSDGRLPRHGASQYEDPATWPRSAVAARHLPQQPLPSAIIWHQARRRCCTPARPMTSRPGALHDPISSRLVWLFETRVVRGGKKQLERGVLEYFYDTNTDDMLSRSGRIQRHVLVEKLKTAYGVYGSRGGGVGPRAWLTRRIFPRLHEIVNTWDGLVPIPRAMPNLRVIPVGHLSTERAFADDLAAHEKIRQRRLNPSRLRRLFTRQKKLSLDSAWWFYDSPRTAANTIRNKYRAQLPAVGSRRNAVPRGGLLPLR